LADVGAESGSYGGVGGRHGGVGDAARIADDEAVRAVVGLARPRGVEPYIVTLAAEGVGDQKGVGVGRRRATRAPAASSGRTRGFMPSNASRAARVAPHRERAVLDRALYAPDLVDLRPSARRGRELGQADWSSVGPSSTVRGGSIVATRSENSPSAASLSGGDADRRA